MSWFHDCKFLLFSDWSHHHSLLQPVMHHWRPPGTSDALHTESNYEKINFKSVLYSVSIWQKQPITFLKTWNTDSALLYTLVAPSFQRFTHIMLGINQTLAIKVLDQSRTSSQILGFHTRKSAYFLSLTKQCRAKTVILGNVIFSEKGWGKLCPSLIHISPISSLMFIKINWALTQKRGQTSEPLLTSSLLFLMCLTGDHLMVSGSNLSAAQSFRLSSSLPPAT